MSRPLRTALIAGSLFALLPTKSAAAADSNEMCPVLPSRKATDDYTLSFQGRAVRFCCNECKAEFEESPEVYVRNVPQLKDRSLQERSREFISGNTGWLISAGLLVVLAGLMLLRRMRPKQDRASRFGRLFQCRISPIWPLAAVVGLLCVEVYRLRAERYEMQLERYIHFATFYDFGRPPVPKRPPVEKRLASTYYRGNDERSPKLFNDGNYRTATFHLSVCDEEGSPLNHGDDAQGRELFVKLEIVRPPFTPDFLYDKERMARMFLTRQCETFLGRDEPVSDRVDLTEVEDMQRWEARFPIGGYSDCCNEPRGIIYICEEYHNHANWWTNRKARLGSRFHYGIVYDLEFEEGVLTAQSDLFMGALYRTNKFPAWKVPLTEWFSHEPIPELPAANTDDPDLLGISDYLED